MGRVKSGGRAGARFGRKQERGKKVVPFLAWRKRVGERPREKEMGGKCRLEIGGSGGDEATIMINEGALMVVAMNAHNDPPPPTPSLPSDGKKLVVCIKERKEG
jgi:hypothetical protein